MGATKNVAANIFDNVKTAPVVAATAATTETLEQKVARLEAELEAANAKKGGFKAGTVTMKIGDGAVSVHNGVSKATKVGNVRLYGIQRMPISLWINQWETLSNVLSGQVKIRLAGVDGEFTFSELTAMGEEKGLITRK